MSGDPTHTASKKEMAPHAPAINYHLKSEVSITLHCQLCSTHYTALEIKKFSKSTLAINVATIYEKCGRFLLRKEAITRY